MSTYLPDNPYALGTRECWRFEKTRHDNTAFGSYQDRSESYDRLSQAMSALLKTMRENHKRLYDPT